MTIEEDEARIRKSATLIEAEKDTQKLVILAAELDRLLRLKLERQKTPTVTARWAPSKPVFNWSLRRMNSLQASW
jgi:hypothetical protein